MSRTDVLPWSIACDASLNLHFAASRDRNLNDHACGRFAGTYHSQYGFGAFGIAADAFQQDESGHECLGVWEGVKPSHHDTILAAMPAGALIRAKKCVTHLPFAIEQAGTLLIRNCSCARRGSATVRHPALPHSS